MKSNVELLKLMNFPVFSDEKELACLIHVSLGLIRILSKFSHRYYKKYKIPKSNGGFREIKQPRKDLKAIQAWILRNILDRLSPSSFATAYIRRKNIQDNVFPHRNNRYFVSIDLEDFFPSISMRRVAKIFSLIGYSRKAASILAQLCTCDGNLPQGAVTSPALSNLITAKLDRRISGYTSRRNMIYTRYADDITISSNNPTILCQALPRIINIIKSEHFKINLKKLRVLGPRRRCSITGLVKNNSVSKFGIGRKKKRELRAIMHYIALKRTPTGKYRNEKSVIGWLNYLKSVDVESFGQMKKYWDCLKSAANS
jgi:hypothetical protein